VSQEQLKLELGLGRQEQGLEQLQLELGEMQE
jgi:hypothetical protein